MKHSRPVPKKNNLTVYPRRNEPIERTIKRFIKKTKKLGIIDEYKEKQRYQKPSEKRRLRNKRSDAKRRKEQKKQKQ